MVFEQTHIAMATDDAGKQYNFRIARRLDEVAQILEAQGDNPYRIRAYRRAADTLRRLTRSAEVILRHEGEPGLQRLPGIGDRLARSIATLIVTGRLPMLGRLRGESDPDALLSSIPGIGRQLARRLRRELNINTLEQLEAAAHDGRLLGVAGVGRKRLAGIIDSLATRLGRLRPTSKREKLNQPSIAEILDVDREYREQAVAGKLHKIAPRRFNPDREAWLPILHTTRGERHYTVLFSNTARAHEMGMTHDWVVIYYDGRSGEHQSTVITSRRGPLIGERIVRGRENECLEYYNAEPKRNPEQILTTQPNNRALAQLATRN